VHKIQASHLRATLHTQKPQTLAGTNTLSVHYFPMALNQNATEGNQMLVALEINFAGWGMIICAAMEVAQYFDAF
jgi:hypothetical protein